MINSMTGFGSCDGGFGGASYEVEIKSINSRYYKSRIKLPDMLSFMEEDIDKLMRTELSRGTINYALKLKHVPAGLLFDIDEDALKVYIEKLGKITSNAGIESRLDVASLLNLPGIIQSVGFQGQEAEKIKEFILSLSVVAVERLKQMRAVEGASIEADLANNCEQICKDAEQISKLAEKNLVEYYVKLGGKVDSLLAELELKLNEETLAREVAVYAERADISEELSRLNSHLSQFSESCKMNRQAGRRLDFIAQEMLREANTIGSKANDKEIANLVVDMKCCIDRIKEQVQNIE